MGTKSMPMIRLDIGMCSLATCIHDPGAAQRSMQTLDFCKNSCFLFNCTNLNEARERNPSSLADQYALSRLCFPTFFLTPIFTIQKLKYCKIKIGSQISLDFTKLHVLILVLKYSRSSMIGNGITKNFELQTLCILVTIGIFHKEW